MSTLLQLPTEVLLNIIDDAPFIATEAICLTCKTLHALAQDKLLKLAKRKGEFENVACGDFVYPSWQSQEPYYARHPLYWLRDILASADVEDIASYPTSMVVKFDVGLHNNNEGLMNNMLDIFDDFEARIVETIVDVYGSFQKEDGSLGARVSDGIFSTNRTASLALLITLLPNLRTLTIIEDEGEPVRNVFHETIDRMVNPSSGKSPDYIQGCQKLSEVRLSSHDDDYVMSGGGVCSFLAMPSVSVIKDKSLDGDLYGDEPWPWPCTRSISNVTDLELSSSALRSKQVTRYLSYIKALQRFSYHFDWDMCDESRFSDWDPIGIIEGLRAHARESLVHLELTANTPPSILEDQLMGNYISDLRDFENLRTLRLQSTAMSSVAGKAVAFDMEYRPDAPELAEKYQMRKTGRTRKTARLIDMLPSSIESIILVGDMSHKQADVMLEDLAKLKEGRLPNLRDIVFEDNDFAEAFDEMMIEECKGTNINLSHRESDEYRQWKIFPS